MASSYKDSWVRDLRKLICTNHGRGWRVKGEGSDRTNVIYFINESKGAANNRLTNTMNINWQKFILSTVNSENKDKWLMDRPKWLNNKDFETTI